MTSHCIHFAGQNSYCQSMTWPIMTMTRFRLIFPCIICEQIISAQGLVINHLKNIHVVLVLACMLCGNTSWCLSPPIEHITSVHVLPFQPSGRKLNLRLCHDNIYCSIPQPCLFDDLTLASPHEPIRVFDFWYTGSHWFPPPAARRRLQSPFYELADS